MPLQTNQVAAQGAYTAATEALQQGSMALGVAMQGSAQQGQSLRDTMQQHAEAAARQLAQHAEAVAASVQQQVQGLGDLRAAQQDKCRAGGLELGSCCAGHAMLTPEEERWIGKERIAC
jgi:hypothetical protein